MVNVLAASPDQEFLERVAAACDGRLAVATSESPASTHDLLAVLGPDAVLPGVVVLDAAPGPKAALVVAQELLAAHPGTAAIVRSPFEQLNQDALHHGVAAVVPASASVAELRDAITRADAAVAHHRANFPIDYDVDGYTGQDDPEADYDFADYQARAYAAAPAPEAPAVMVESVAAANGRGRVVTVLSPKGGVGKTTIATNLASGIAKASPGSVVLLDLDLQFGDVGNALAVKPTSTLEQVVAGTTLTDPLSVKAMLDVHESGLFMLCSPEHPAHAEQISPADVRTLIETLATQFRFVIIDTAPGLDDMVLTALSRTTDALLVCGMDVQGIRGLYTGMSVLEQLGVLPASRQVVLNYVHPRTGLTVKDVEATIRAKVDYQLPQSNEARLAMNHGVPVTARRPRDPLSKGLRKITDHFLLAAPLREFESVGT